MSNNLYSASNHHYIPPNYYPVAQMANTMHDNVVTDAPLQEATQRKRPKYTRSKTGCLTCRVKKIKCDESKPICTRCATAQRDCTWPEGISTRKKLSKKGSTERPGTACSSGRSETSTPPAASDLSPPMREPCLPTSRPRFPSETYLPLPSYHQVPEPPGPHSSLGSMPNHSQRAMMHGYPSMPNYPTPHPNPVPMIPDTPPYPMQPRYHPGYVVSRTPSDHAIPIAVRSMPTHSSSNEWNHPVMMSANVGDPQSFYHPVHDRNLLASHHVHHGRYQ